MVTPIRSTDVCNSRFSFQEWAPRSSRCTPNRVPTRPGSCRFTSTRSLRRACRAFGDCSSSDLTSGVPLMPRHCAGCPDGSHCVHRRRPAGCRETSTGRTRQPRSTPPSRVNGPGLDLTRGTFPSVIPINRAGVPTLASRLLGEDHEASAVSTNPRGTCAVPRTPFSASLEDESPKNARPLSRSVALASLESGDAIPVRE